MRGASQSGRRVVSAFIATAFAQDDAEQLKQMARRRRSAAPRAAQARRLPRPGGDRRPRLHELPLCASVETLVINSRASHVAGLLPSDESVVIRLLVVSVRRL